MMINFATLVGRVPGATALDAGNGGSPVPAEGGEFAALVQLAAGAATDQASGADAGLHLAVDNGAPEGADLAMQTAQADQDLVALVTGQMPITRPVSEAVADPQPGKLTEAAPATTTAKVGPAIDPAATMGPITDMALPVAMVDGEADPEAGLPGDPEQSAEAAEQVPVPTNTALPAPMVVVAPPVVMSSFRAVATGARAAQAASLPIEREIKDAAARASVPDEAVAGEAGAQTGGETRMSFVESLTATAVPRAATETPVAVVQPGVATPTVRGVAGLEGPSMAEALGSEVIDMGVSGQWIDRLAREIAGVAAGTGHSRFTLSPPHLGRLQVDIIKTADLTDVRLLTETDEAAQRLNEGRPALHADARVAAINLGQITVEKASSAFESATRDQGQPQREMADQMQHQQQQERQANARGAQGEWSDRTRADRAGAESNQAAPKTRGRDSANSNVRFA